MIGVKKKAIDSGGTTASAFRERLERVMEQMASDRSSPFGAYIPMLVGAMASMSDADLLQLRQFLVALVGNEDR